MSLVRVACVVTAVLALGAIGTKQGAIGTKQGVIGTKHEIASKQAQTDSDALIARAVASGVAKPF